MLYKNLPQEELGYVMRVRAVLDCVAALSFLLKGQFANMWAVVRARRAFQSLRPLFAATREENLKKNFSWRYSRTDKKQYLGAVLFAWEESLFTIIILLTTDLQISRINTDCSFLPAVIGAGLVTVGPNINTGSSFCLLLFEI